ncbi:MFS transporter [Corynebacterium uterequi]|uniref:Arabinose efflux permease family protein n=1 Tax=Corynebacterium uterequi TaxID=1072256 RepID=A0A0G3HIE9_9CORY|nr:MFS transporter [Corynebacterium uterequi]AKK11673.1 arabinose efflux permease family protein [Corynebacterium uterequi]
MPDSAGQHPTNGVSITAYNGAHTVAASPRLPNPGKDLSVSPVLTRRHRSMAIAAFGTIVEWYDFSIFFYVATSLTTVYFGGDSTNLLFTLGIAAVGFLFRPIGAMVFGHLGDRIGRRNSLVISTSLMALAMIGIAAVPGADTIGAWGGVAVILLRCLAGFSVGAEYTGIMVYLMESATARNRGFAASLAVVSSEVGSLLAVGLGAGMSRSLSPEQMDAWGWRVLFLVGGLMALSMIPLRGQMEETHTFERSRNIQRRTGRSPLVAVLTEHPRSVLLAFLISATGSVTYFLNITHVPTYLEITMGLDSAVSLWLGTVAALAAIIATPLVGLAADRVGRRRLFVLILAVVVLGTVPAYQVLAAHGSTVALIGVTALAVPAAAWSAVAASAVPEQFTAVGRFSGMAIGYNAATAVFGGGAPLIATWLQNVSGSPLAPALFATVVAVCAGGAAVVLMRDMTGRPLVELDEETSATASE